MWCNDRRLWERIRKPSNEKGSRFDFYSCPGDNLNKNMTDKIHLISSKNNQPACLVTSDCEVVCGSNVFASRQHLTQSFFLGFFLASICSSLKQQITPFASSTLEHLSPEPRDNLMTIFSQPAVFPLHLQLLDFSPSYPKIHVVFVMPCKDA